MIVFIKKETSMFTKVSSIKYTKTRIAIALIVTITTLNLFSSYSIAMASNSKMYKQASTVEEAASRMLKGKPLKKNNRKTRDKIIDDIENLESIGVNSDNLSLADNTGNEDFLYNLQLGNNVTDQIKIKETTSGNLKVDIFEDDIHDIILFESDGSILVNGKHVVFETSEEHIDMEVIPQARTSVYSSKPFKGKKSNYTKKIKTYRKDSVNTGNLIKDLAVGTIATLISSALSATLPGNVAISAVSTLASKMKNAAETHGPKSAYFSYEVVKKEYPQKTTLNRYYMHTGKYYIYRNCTGYYVDHTFYEHNFFN